jgi:hypothetical protein
MSADAVSVLIRQKHVVSTDGHKPGVTDFHLVVKLYQTLGLAPILGAVSAPAEHQDQGAGAHQPDLPEERQAKRPYVAHSENSREAGRG